MAENNLNVIRSNDFIANVNILVDNLEAIKYSNEIFDNDYIVQVLEELDALDDGALDLIASDLQRGVYINSRKLDIDMNLNMTPGATEPPYYKTITVYYDDGSTTVINVSPSFNSSTELYDKLKNHPDIQSRLLSNTDISAPSLDADTDADLVRITDKSGGICDIDYVVLDVDSTRNALYINSRPLYDWASTTSALRVIAAEIGDVIALGKDIPDVSKVADQLPVLMYVASEIPEILRVADVIPDIEFLVDAYPDIMSAAATATTKATEASNSANLAGQYAADIQSRLNIQATTNQYGVAKFAKPSDYIDFSNPNDTGSGASDALYITNLYDINQRMYFLNQTATINSAGRVRLMAPGSLPEDYNAEDPVVVTPRIMASYVASAAGGSGGSNDLYLPVTGVSGLMMKKTSRPRTSDTVPETFCVEIFGTITTTATTVSIPLTGNVIDTYIAVSGSVDSPTTMATIRRDPTSGLDGSNSVNVGIWNGTAWVAGSATIRIIAIIDLGNTPPTPNIGDFVIRSDGTNAIIISNA